MHGAKRARNVALILAVASLFCWCQSSAESCVELSEAIGALDSGALVELGEHIGAEPSKSAAAIAQAKPSVETLRKAFLAGFATHAKLRSVHSQLNTSSPASKWLGAFNSTAVDEVPGDDGVRNVNGELYSEQGGWQDLTRSEWHVKGCATMQTNSSEKMGYYVDKPCAHDSDTKYIGGHQHYRNKLNTHLGEEVEDKLGSGRSSKKSRPSSKKSSLSSKKSRPSSKKSRPSSKKSRPSSKKVGPPEKVEKDGQTWTKCRTAIISWRTTKSASCKHGLYKNRCLPDKGYVFQMRVMRTRICCTSCKPGYVFIMWRHKDRTGECREYKSKAEIQCTELHTNNLAAPGAKATLCTKIARVEAGFNMDTLKKNETRKNHFAKAEGQYGKVVPQCDLRKETVCVNGNCDVKKQAVCNTVCKYKDGMARFEFLKDPKFVKKNCFPELCEGEYGELACTVVATMG